MGKGDREIAGKELKAFLLEKRNRYCFTSEKKSCIGNAYLLVTMGSRSMVPDDSIVQAPASTEMYSMLV